MISKIVRCLSLFGGASVLTWTGWAAEFLAGADFSHLAFFESRNAVYKDAGQAGDALLIAKRHGLSCIRLRLFTSSPVQAAADPYNYINNLDYTVPLAVRVKNAGLSFMLDFHYSDTWADPGHQRKPAAWTNLDFPQLVQQMRSYNSNCIAAFKQAGAMPDYVQVGNEITGGLLWPDGRVGGTYDTPAQWSQLGQLLKAAIEGIRDASGPNVPKLVIHIDRGGDWAATQWYFDNLRQQQVSFDIVGESYYPFWQGPLASLANCLTNAAQRYQKTVIVAETAFPWNSSVWTTNIVGIAPGRDGQVRFVAELATILNRVPNALGAGVFWWGAEYQAVAGVNGAGFSNTSFFDGNGDILPLADSFGHLLAPLKLNAKFEGSSLELNWPLSGAGFALKVAPDLSSAPNWISVTNQVATNSVGFELAVPFGQ